VPRRGREGAGMAPELFWLVFLGGFVAGWLLSGALIFTLWFREIDRRPKGGR
jgi:hypothetical protein